MRFRRQHSIDRFIVDFYCAEDQLVIEIDGGQHNKDESRETDEKRTEWLKEIGYEVLRFWDNEVLTNIEGVLEKIREALV